MSSTLHRALFAAHIAEPLKFALADVCDWLPGGLRSTSNFGSVDDRLCEENPILELVADGAHCVFHTPRNELVLLELMEADVAMRKLIKWVVGGIL